MKTECDEYFESCQYQLGHLVSEIVECLEQLECIERHPLIATLVKEHLLAHQSKSIHLLVTPEAHIVAFRKLIKSLRSQAIARLQ